MWDKKTSEETSIEFIVKELMQQRLASERQIDKDDKWRIHVESKLGTCPEGSHIKEQNGKIDRIIKDQSSMANEISEQRGTIRFWCYIFSALIASLAIGTFVSAMIPKVEPICKAHISQDQCAAPSKK